MKTVKLTEQEIEYLLSLMPPAWAEDTPQEVVKLKNKLRGIDNTRKAN